MTTTLADNDLLAVLSQEELRRLRGELEPIALLRKNTLIEAGARIKDLFFPTSAVISCVHVLADGNSAEIGVIGSEGCVGVCHLLGGERAGSKAVVRMPGQGYRIRASVMNREFRRGGRFHQAVLRHAHSLIGQLSQIVACNRHHSVDQQLCRWLLTSVDRSDSDDLLTTHEWIGSLLGIRREGVSEAVLKLQKLGAIRNARGRITILSRSKLEARACECYFALRARQGVL